MCAGRLDGTLTAVVGPPMLQKFVRIQQGFRLMPLSAVILNCSLKPSPIISNTRSLIDVVCEILESIKVECEVIRVVDYSVAYGVNCQEEGDDQWPEILPKIRECDVFIVATPIWFGNRSSICQKVFERLDGTFAQGSAENGQYPLYNKVGGVIVTGNEDGAQHVASTVLFNLSQLGCTIPPNAYCYWVGDAGPGPSFVMAGGHSHHFTRRTARYMAHNIANVASLLSQYPIPTNLRKLTEEADVDSSGSRQQRHGDGCDW